LSLLISENEKLRKRDFENVVTSRIKG